jgi:hypothetical protein
MTSSPTVTVFTCGYFKIATPIANAEATNDQYSYGCDCERNDN